MIRAAMVTPNMTLGGAERWIVDLIKHSDPERLVWTGVAMSGYGGADPHLTAELAPHVKMYTHSATKRPPHAKPFCHDHVTDLGGDFNDAIEFVAEDADVVVSWGSCKMGRWFSGITCPRVLCSHASAKEPALHEISGITHLTGVSKRAMRFFEGRNRHNLPETVLWNGSDPERVATSSSARRDRRNEWKTSGRCVIGYLGRQTEEKNYEAACLAVHALGEDFQAVYYGWDKTGKRVDPVLREWCDEYLPGQCLFYHPVPKVGDILAGLDVFMLASHREAFSLGLIEAWLAGVPVVGTPVGSVPELEEEFGPLVHRVPLRPTQEQLADAVREAVADGGERARHAQEVARQHFTIQAMARRWEDYLEAVVQGSI